VNKNRDILNLLVRSSIYVFRTFHVTMVSCLLSFIFSGNTNCNFFIFLILTWSEVFMA